MLDTASRIRQAGAVSKRPPVVSLPPPRVTPLYGARRLAYLALCDFHDMPVGYVITKNDTETLGAIHSQVERGMTELDELAAERMGADRGNELAEVML